MDNANLSIPGGRSSATHLEIGSQSRVLETVENPYYGVANADTEIGAVKITENIYYE